MSDILLVLLLILALLLLLGMIIVVTIAFIPDFLDMLTEAKEAIDKYRRGDR